MTRQVSPYTAAAASFQIGKEATESQPNRFDDERNLKAELLGMYSDEDSVISKLSDKFSLKFWNLGRKK